MNRIKHHVKKGDQVEVISGNFRGSTGKILQVISRKDRVLIEGVRMIKKHLRKSQDNPVGLDRGARGSDSHLERESGRAQREGGEKEEQNQSDEGEEEERKTLRRKTSKASFDSLQGPSLRSG